MKKSTFFFLVTILFLGIGLNSCKEKKQKLVCADRGGVNLIRDQYWLHVQLFNNVIEGISEEDANKRISNNTNSFKWIAGHTLDIQYNLASALGVTDPAENPYKAQFSYGKLFDPEATDYPTLDEMKADWNRLAPEIMDAMGDTPITEFSADLPGIPFPNETKEGREKNRRA